MPNISSNMNKKGFLSELLPMWVAIFGLVFATGSLVAQEADSSEDSDKVVEEDEDEESDDDALLEEDVVNEDGESDSESEYDEEDMEQVHVTGSYMPISDPTANINRYTAEEIRQMGASDFSDFFRKIPQQFNSTNPQTSTIFDTGDNLGGDSGGLYYNQNLATVNLHGMGSGNTLVLLDGRRVAGFGGSERDVVNILGIPMEAIEAVEIMMDGGSAVYGVDAIAGVVNFITKKNYRGMSVNMKQDNSYTGADDYTHGMTFGFNWAKFRTTVSIESSEREPIINSKAGHSTRDFRELLGRPEFDFRFYTYSQPGIVREWNGSVQYPGPYYSDYYIDGSFNIDWEKRDFVAQLPSDHTGLNSTPEDFKYGLSNVDPYNRVAPVTGAHTSRDGGTMNIYYDLTDRVELFFNSRYSVNKSYQEIWSVYSLAVRLVVPASNAYNPFGRPMYVAYVPGREQETGVLPIPFRKAEGTDKNVTMGVKWRWAGQNEIALSVTEGRSNNENRAFQSTTRRERYAPGTDEFYRRLSSPDPDEAFNIFGNGTEGGAPFSQFLGESSLRIGTNRVTEMAVTASGFWFEMNGERVSYSLTYSRRATRYTNRYIYFAGLTPYEFDYNAVWNGITEPVSRSDRLGFELWLPVLSSEKGSWWGQELQVTFKNSYVGNYNWGAVGGFDYERELVDVDAWNPDTTDWETFTVNSFQYGVGPDAEYIKYSERDNAPSVGFYYEFRDDLIVRLNFSRNVEPPLTSELYDTYEAFDWFVNDVIDLYDPRGPQFYERVPYRYSYANPELKSSVSENWSLRAVWAPEYLRGLEFDITYRHASHKNKVDRGTNYTASSGLTELLRYPEIGVRTPEGYLDFISYDYFNAYEDRDRSLSFFVKYRMEREWLGILETRINLNKILEREREPLKGLIFSALGTARDPDRYRGSLQFLWDKNKISATLTGHHTPGYLNERAMYCSFQQIADQVGECALPSWTLHYISLDVASQTTWDLSFSYTFSPNYQLSFNSNNVFNRGAPLTVRGAPSNPLPYDATRWDARGRVLSLSFRYTPSF